MIIKTLFIDNFRSIPSMNIELSPTFNLFFGENGVGKTSILEAVHLLSLGRSFRPGRLANLIQHDKPALTVGAKIIDSLPLGLEHSLGLRYDRKTILYKLNRERVRGVTALSSQLPVLIFEPSTSSYLLGESKARRRLVDWGCFQETPTFIQTWRNYKRALVQRNAALRAQSKKSLINLWDKELCSQAEILSSFRHSYVNALDSEISRLLKDIPLTYKITLGFRKGWGKERPLFTQLQNSLDSDRRRGFTRLGSHRDDIFLNIDGRSLSVEGSRGQIKFIVLIMRLAQASLLEKTMSKKPVLLLDDLASELDKKSFSRVWEVICSLKLQILMSAVDRKDIQKNGDGDSTMFHVKHGRIDR